MQQYAALLCSTSIEGQAHAWTVTADMYMCNTLHAIAYMLIMMIADCYAPVLIASTPATACCTCMNSQS